MFASRSSQAALAVALVAVASIASADGSKLQPQQQYRDFFRCATTPAVDFPGTIVAAALATPDLKALADAVVLAGLDGTLSGPGPFTV